MSLVEGFLETFFQEVLWASIKRLGSLVRWAFLYRKHSYKDIYTQAWNGRVGILTICLVIGLIIILNVKINDEKAVGNTFVKLHPLKKRYVLGYFDGDGTQDTISQHIYSRLTKTEIHNAPDPFQNEWDTVVKWFYDQDADLYLTMKNNQDTLHLGTAQGLYCLINIGDNNADGKDEIALVIDYLDYSRLNSCKIYSLCHDKWTLLKQFEVHEDSFDFTGDNAPLFDNIKDQLEKQNGKWVYKDYSQDNNDTEEVAVMTALELDRCE